MPDLPLAPWESPSAAPPPVQPIPSPDAAGPVPGGGSASLSAMTPEQQSVAKGLGAAAELFGPYIKGAAGAPRLGQQIERGAAESAAGALETADQPRKWLLGEDKSPYGPAGLARKIRSIEPEAPPPAQGWQQKATDIAGQVIGAAPVGLAEWQLGVPWAMLRGTGVAENIAKSKGKEATGWEKIRDTLVEGGQRAFMGWIMRSPWGATRAFGGALGGGVASEAEGRGHESAAVDAGLNALFGLIGPSMSPKDRAKIKDIQLKAASGDYRAFDTWLKDPKNAELVAKPMAMAARDRGDAAPKGEQLPPPPPSPGGVPGGPEQGGPPPPEPIVAYHGTTKDFDQFDPSMTRGGNPAEEGATFFSRQPSGANKYATGEGANVRKVKIDPTNHATYDPVELLNNPETRESFLEDLKNSFMATATRNEYLKDRFGTPEGRQELEAHWELEKQKLLDQAADPYKNGISFSTTVGAIIARAKREGAESAAIKNLMESRGEDQLIVLNPERVTPFWQGEHGDGGQPPEPPSGTPPTEPPIPPVPAGKFNATRADNATAWERSTAEAATQITHMDRGNAIARSVVTPEVENMWRGMPDNDRIRVMSDYMRGNTEHMPPEIKQFFDTSRGLFDREYTAEQQAGIDTDWRENYWPAFWTDESRAAQMRTGGGGGPSFARGKIFDDLQEGIDAGLTPKYTNPAVYVLARLEHGELWKSRLETMKAYEKVGVAGRDADIPKDERGRRPFEWQGYDELDLAGTRYLVHPQAAKVFRRGLRMEAQAMKDILGSTAAGHAYDAWMAVRNATVPTKLALSAFHAFHVSSIGAKSEIAGLLSQLLNKRITFQEFRDAMTTSSRGRYETGKLDAGNFSKRLEDLGLNDRIAQWANLAGGFTPQRPSVYEIHSEQKLRRLFNDTIPTLEQELNAKNTGTLGRLFKMAPEQARGLALQMGKIIEDFQHPVFGDWIPAIKQSAYLNEVAAYIKGHPEELAATEASTIKLKAGLRNIQKSIDNRFGEMDYNKIFMPTLVRKIAVASLLSVGWQLGFLREFGGGIMDAGKWAVTGGEGNLMGYAAGDPRRAEVTTRTAYALTYTAGSIAMGGLATYIMTGDMPKGKDWVYPRMADGTHINTPLFTREFAAMFFHWQNEGLIPGSISLVENKLTPMVGTLAEIYKNEDYFGHQIYDDHAPLFKQIEQGAEHFGIKTTVPIAIESIAGNKIDDPAKIALSLGGFSPAPKYATKTKAESAVERSYKKFGTQHKVPYLEVQQFNDKHDLKMAFQQAKRSGSPEDAQSYQTARAAYLEKYKGVQSPKGLKTSERAWGKPNDFGLFAQLPPTEQEAQLKEFTPAEREKFRWSARVLIRNNFPMVDEETFRNFEPDEQAAIVDAAPKAMKSHYLEMSGADVRRKYGLDPKQPPPGAPWEQSPAPKPQQNIPQAPWETVQ